MKYCPYCGADLIDGAASFCTECGKNLPTSPAPHREVEEHTPPEPPHTQEELPQEFTQQASSEPEEPVSSEPVYDGYYDDVQPADLDRQREGIDKALLRKLAFVGGGFLVVIALCLTALSLL